MWYLEKEVTISAAHHLENYRGPCKSVHGHNWRVVIYCKRDILADTGMVIDFRDIKNIVDQLDHRDINFVTAMKNPTAEQIAKWLYERIPFCYKVMVEETKGSRCTYVADN